MPVYVLVSWGRSDIIEKEKGFKHSTNISLQLDTDCPATEDELKNQNTATTPSGLGNFRFGITIYGGLTVTIVTVLMRTRLLVKTGWLSTSGVLLLMKVAHCISQLEFLTKSPVDDYQGAFSWSIPPSCLPGK